jgi:putative transposase
VLRSWSAKTRSCAGTTKFSSWRVLFCPGGALSPTQVWNDFVEKHRDIHGVELICKVLQNTQSGYRRHASQQRNPNLRFARVKLDNTLKQAIQRFCQANMRDYGADKVWKQMNREGMAVTRCTVERLMRSLGLRDVRRGKVVRTTIGDVTAFRPLDRVNR